MGGREAECRRRGHRETRGAAKKEATTSCRRYNLVVNVVSSASPRDTWYRGHTRRQLEPVHGTRQFTNDATVLGHLGGQRLVQGSVKSRLHMSVNRGTGSPCSPETDKNTFEPTLVLSLTSSAIKGEPGTSAQSHAIPIISDEVATKIAPGTKCTEEGRWNCISGDTFQRCGSGVWSVVQKLAYGRTCESRQSTYMEGLN